MLSIQRHAMVTQLVTPSDVLVMLGDTLVTPTHRQHSPLELCQRGSYYATLLALKAGQ
jgi:hypothetical protein